MKQVELFNDHFQNFKVYGIPKAQLIIADPPYNLGVNAYASNPSWYVGGDNKNGEMIFNCMEFPRELGMPRTHPTQKPIPLLKRLIGLFTDPDDVVIDPTA